MKPRIFIGSSKESVKIAEKVKSLLDGEYVCQLWCDNFFDLGQCTYHELEQADAYSRISFAFSAVMPHISAMDL